MKKHVTNGSRVSVIVINKNKIKDRRDIDVSQNYMINYLINDYLIVTGKYRE